MKGEKLWKCYGCFKSNCSRALMCRNMNHVCHVIVTHKKIIAIEEKQTCPKTSTYATIQTPLEQSV